MKKPFVTVPVNVTDGYGYIKLLESIGRFHVPFNELERKDENRFCTATIRLDFCMTWVWLNWLTRVTADSLVATVNEMLNRSLKLMGGELPAPEEARTPYWRGEHDKECFHLAAIAGNQDLLAKIASLSTYALDNKGIESCQQAWAGLWKFSLLGDRSRAAAQMELMFDSPRPINLRLPRRQVVEGWLREDWKQFNRGLQSAYAQRWTAYRKYRLLGRDDDTGIEVALQKINGRTIASWQENAFAINAWLRGVDIPFDPLFLPVTSVTGLVKD